MTYPLAGWPHLSLIHSGRPHRGLGRPRRLGRFPEAMADAAASVVRHFDGRIVYVNVMKNLSVDCDCVMHPEKPCMHDIGILSSLDPVAIDQACMDLVIGSDDPGRDRFLERVNSRNGIHTIEAAADLGIGSREYELVEL